MTRTYAPDGTNGLPVTHTPGPWHIQYGGMTTDDCGFGIASKIAPGIVAECYPPAADLERWQRLLADATLISSAPTLLECLIAALPTLRAYAAQFRANEDLLGDVRRAEAAIATAKGELR